MKIAKVLGTDGLYAYLDKVRLFILLPSALTFFVDGVLVVQYDLDLDKEVSFFGSSF